MRHRITFFFLFSIEQKCLSWCPTRPIQRADRRSTPIASPPTTSRFLGTKNLFSSLSISKVSHFPDSGNSPIKDNETSLSLKNNVIQKQLSIDPNGSSPKSNSRNSTYLIHKGRAIDMIKRCVSVEGLNLSTGWTPQATQAFQIAIEAVVRKNPILTGKIIEKKSSPWPWSRKELHIIPSAYSPDSHSFVSIVEPPVDMVNPSEILRGNRGNAKELFEYVHSNVAPSLLGKPDFTVDQIRSGSPLFEAKIMDFGDGNAAYAIKMSHAVGDGTTFFQIVSQISSYMNGRDPAEINWDNPLKAEHEIYPPNFSERDYHRSYGLPFGWGLFKNIRTLNKRKCKYLLLSKEKIARKRNEFRQSNDENVGVNGECRDDKKKSLNDSISANDIIMSAICEMNGSADIFAFDRSIRGLKDGVGKSAAGNFFIEVPFEKEKGKCPFEIRKILTSDSGSYFDTNEIPLMPFLNGRVGRITSLASVTHQATFPGTEVVCQFPSASFIRDLPLDVAVIFRFGKDYWGIMHNFKTVNESPLLEEILA